MGIAAGPIIGFLGNYVSHKLLKYYTIKHTNSPFLSGSEFGFKKIDLLNIQSLVSIQPSSDGPQIWRILKKKDYKNYECEWYHPLLHSVTLLALKYLLGPYL